jgi:hypothetical protein
MTDQQQSHHSDDRAHGADVAVFILTTTLCALGALMLPLAG